MDWLPALTSIMRSFSIFNLNLSDIIGGFDACTFHVPFMTNFSFHMILLPVLICAIGLAAFVVRICRGGSPLIRARSMRVANLIVFILYPGICSKVFAMLKCRQVQSSDYLVADFSVACWEGDHLQSLAWVFLSLILFVLGIPLLAYTVLRANRSHLYDETSPKHGRIALAFGSLYQSYEPEYFYWECVEMLRKMLLTGAVQLVGSGTSAQALFAVLVCLAHLMLVMRAAPYEDALDDVLQFLTTLSLLVTLILGMALDSDSQGDVYDRAFMDVLLVLINVSVGSIGIMMILMALPCFRNSKRLMRCMKQDGKERNFKKEADWPQIHRTRRQSIMPPLASCSPWLGTLCISTWPKRTRRSTLRRDHNTQNE